MALKNRWEEVEKVHKAEKIREGKRSDLPKLWSLLTRWDHDLLQQQYFFERRYKQKHQQISSLIYFVSLVQHFSISWLSIHAPVVKVKVIRYTVRCNKHEAPWSGQKDLNGEHGWCTLTACRWAPAWGMHAQVMWASMQKNSAEAGWGRCCRNKRTHQLSFLLADGVDMLNPSSETDVKILVPWGCQLPLVLIVRESAM